MNPRNIFGTVFGVDAWIAIGVFSAICSALGLALLLSTVRKRHGKAPSRRAEWTRLELLYGCLIAAGAVSVIVLSIHTNDEEHASAATPAARVSVTGYQWCWQFSYPGHDIHITAQCQAGHRPTMVVPVGEPVTVSVTSDDVIHSWYVPELRYKMDAFPNHVNRVTILVDHAGTWIGRCAEFCGENHATMDFYLKAVSPTRYRQWLASGGTTAA